MDFTKGYSRRDLIRFLVPLIAAELFQQIYSLINTIVVNRVLDHSAVAVIGACSGFLSIRGNLIAGMILGFGIYISRAVGSRDRKYFLQAFSGAFCCALALGLLGLALLPWIGAMLTVGNIPEELSQDAARYLSFSFGGCICIALKMLLMVTLQAIGDTKFFSFLAAAGVIVNTVLVVLFVGVFHGGVAFSALATILTNLVLAGCLYSYIHRKHPDVLKLVSPRLIPSGIWLNLIKNGVAKTVYFMLGSFGKLLLQRTINTFSVEVIAGQAWAVCLQTILFAPLGELGTASGVITGQNVGAKNMENIRTYHRKLCRGMLLIGAVEVLFVYLLGYPLLRVLCGSDKPIAVAQAANQWLCITVLVMPLCMTILYRNALQAMGRYPQVVLLGAVEFVGICLTISLFVPAYGYSSAAAGVAASWLVQAVFGFCFFHHAMKGEHTLEQSSFK